MLIVVGGSGGLLAIESTEFDLAPTPSVPILFVESTKYMKLESVTAAHLMEILLLSLGKMLTFNSLPKSARAATMDLALARPTLRLVLGSRRGGDGTLGPLEPTNRKMLDIVNRPLRT